METARIPLTLDDATGPIYACRPAANIYLVYVPVYRPLVPPRPWPACARLFWCTYWRRLRADAWHAARLLRRRRNLLYCGALAALHALESVLRLTDQV